MMDDRLRAFLARFVNEPFNKYTRSFQAMAYKLNLRQVVAFGANKQKTPVRLINYA